MKNLSIFFFGMLLLATACTDPEKDPLQFDKLKEGSLIALRGQAVTNLGTISFRGSVDKFVSTADPATENFEFDADYLSNDVTNLQEVEIYAKATEAGSRVRIATKSGADFKAVTGSTYPRASFSIPMTEILSKIGKSIGDFSSTDTDYTNDYIFIECDLTLKDGSKVLAADIVNSSLFESAIFYPAHNLRYLAVD